jgi:predicted nucleic acid-binding protein
LKLLEKRHFSEVAVCEVSQLGFDIRFLETVPLDKADYQAAIDQMITLNLPGGGVYDALIARAAAKISADRLMTLNAKHFTRLNPTIAQMVFVPA